MTEDTARELIAEMRGLRLAIEGMTAVLLTDGQGDEPSDEEREAAGLTYMDGTPRG